MESALIKAARDAVDAMFEAETAFVRLGDTKAASDIAACRSALDDALYNYKTEPVRRPA